jgi:hypothetical protein
MRETPLSPGVPTVLDFGVNLYLYRLAGYPRLTDFREKIVAPAGVAPKRFLGILS